MFRIVFRFARMQCRLYKDKVQQVNSALTGTVAGTQTYPCTRFSAARARFVSAFDAAALPAFVAAFLAAVPHARFSLLLAVTIGAQSSNLLNPYGGQQPLPFRYRVPGVCARG
jgi:hypothetical protein